MSDLEHARPAGEAMPRRLVGALPTVALVLLALVGAGSSGRRASAGAPPSRSSPATRWNRPTARATWSSRGAAPPEVGDVSSTSPRTSAASASSTGSSAATADDGWVMQGDNNDFTDPFDPHVATRCSASRTCTSAGPARSLLFLSPVVWLSLLLVAAAVLCWPSTRDDEEADGAARRADAADAARRGRPRPGGHAMRGRTRLAHAARRGPDAAGRRRASAPASPRSSRSRRGRCATFVVERCTSSPLTAHAGTVIAGDRPAPRRRGHRASRRPARASGRRCRLSGRHGRRPRRDRQPW